MAQAGMRLRWLALGAVLALPGLTGARVPAYAPIAAAEARPLSQAHRLERRFLQISAANMRFQAEASRLAAARSNNPAVKDLAGTLLARQQTTQPELLRLLHARGMALPIASAQHVKLLRQLSRLNGAKFDHLYVDEVVARSYQDDIANCEKVVAHAEDPVLRAWAEQQLPTLRLHAAKAGKALPAAVLRGQRAV
jgi:putative membrane protein